jgi:hypothetical protein
MGQLNLDLGDRKQYLKALMNRLEKNELQCSGTSLRISDATKEDHFWLVLRTFIYDTEYDYIEMISTEEAIHLCKHYDVAPGHGKFLKEWSNAQPISG